MPIKKYPAELDLYHKNNYYNSYIGLNANHFVFPNGIEVEVSNMTPFLYTLNFNVIITVTDPSKMQNYTGGIIVSYIKDNLNTKGGVSSYFWNRECFLHDEDKFYNFDRCRIYKYGKLIKFLNGLKNLGEPQNEKI